MFLINEQNPLPRRYDDVIETELVDETYREYFLDSRAAEYYKNMLEAAADDGIDLITVSAYRSYDYQKNNFDSNVEDRMAEGMSYAEAYKDSLASVQLPGQSEHNAGLAVDILSNEYNSMDDDGFENTEAFKWLDEHAAEYGFILRYPKGKTDITQIIYEPWHYRFVGIYYA
ncbi:MAG: M15 family metallopeptidase, partial [Oscillospiraceae bacterium]